MKHSLYLIMLLLLLSTTALAQDETLPCDAPYVTEADIATLALSVNDAQFTDEIFANRFLFEQSYDIIKYNVRVTQINEQAAIFGLEPAVIMSNDKMIQQISAELNDSVQLATRVLDELSKDAVIWQYAEMNNLTVSSEAFERAIDSFFVIEEESPEERDIILNNFTQKIMLSGAPVSEMMTFFCRKALYDRVAESISVDMQTTLYANVDHIIVSSQEVALDIVTLLEGGDDFATLAQELSLDTGSAQRGGNLGELPVVLFVREFADAIITGDVGIILAPVETQFGWHVIRINSKEERPVSEEYVQQVQQSLFVRWQEEQLTNATITINPDWQSFIP